MSRENTVRDANGHRRRTSLLHMNRVPCVTQGRKGCQESRNWWQLGKLGTEKGCPSLFRTTQTSQRCPWLAGIDRGTLPSFPIVSYLRSISPSTQKVRTFEMVPPGQHPRMRTAIAWKGFREKLRASRYAVRGMSPNWQISPTAMPQGLLKCDHSFRISTEHPKENMTRPTIRADTTVKTSFRIPWPSICSGSSSSMLWAGQLALLEQSTLILSRELDSRDKEEWQPWACTGQVYPDAFPNHATSDAGESFRLLLANPVIRPNLIKLFTSDIIKVM